jgi:subtilase family serine protease
MRASMVRLRAGLAILAVGLAGSAAESGGVSAASSSTALSAIPGSYLPTGAPVSGAFHSSLMSVEVVLRPGNQARLTSLLGDLYTKGSAQYGKWLAAGQFQREFAPSAASVAAVRTYLDGRGLSVHATSSSFLLRAAGSSAQIEAAFGTTIDNYRSANGTAFFSNNSAASLPSNLAAGVLGVVGLTNTVRLQPLAQVATESATGQSGKPSCEIPYPKTLKQLKAITAPGQPFNGYGGGPGCSGLTPSQTNSLYNAPHDGPAAQGAGATVAVFELSAYTRSDIANWARTFYGSASTPPLKNISVDGGPSTPGDCPKGDTCVYGYGGDDEVEADIEEELSIAPDVDRLLVYNAPNDFTGQTALDEYIRIANQDTADSVSSSWGECEPDSGQSFVQAENLVFEQMAAQGQSMFAASGDTGAFECIRDGTFDNWPPLEQLDPGTQPWVTSAGGTSFESFDPGNNPNPKYPKGVEAVWNTLDLCSGSATGISNCGAYGAAGGGSSIFWPMPAYQRGAGVINPDTVSGPSNCAFASSHQRCREVPDVSADADPLTGYAEYCPGSTVDLSKDNPPGIPYTSACITIRPSTPGAPGWFHIGGTSLDAPLMAAVFADRDAFHGLRTGNANEQLYAFFNTPNRYSLYFHDITGVDQASNNNGHYPVTPGYDEATGIGTPNMTGLITGD